MLLQNEDCRFIEGGFDRGFLAFSTYRADLQKTVDMGRKWGMSRMFDFCIGNPPYQEDTDSESTRMPPVYNYFMSEAYKIAERVELITPARFLFNAGYTPKAWNEQMLKDPHLKVLFYEQDSSKIFSNIDIMGGIVVTYRDSSQKIGPIEIFTTHVELNSIIDKIKVFGYEPIQLIVHPALSYKLSQLMLQENPQSLDRLRTSCFTTLKEIFFLKKPDDEHDYIQLIGILNNKRTYRFVRRDYIVDSSGTLDKYKVIIPASNGSGAIGEVLPTKLIGQPLIASPGLAHTQSFISIGLFESFEPAQACYKYICTKFARLLLGVLKITQHNPPEKWKFVPLQDFTSSSDIDWSQSVADIDRQLYKKYALSSEEIAFIETHVKEME